MSYSNNSKGDALATKKTVVKKTAAKNATTTAAPAKAVGSTKLPATKMTKTQVIRYMAEQMEVPPKQVSGFFNLLIETATTQTRKQGEFTIPGLGKLVKAQRAARIGRNPADRRGDQDQGQDDREVPAGQGRQGRGGPTQSLML